MRNALLLILALAVGCEAPDPELIPDQRLQAELGLTVDDRVHTVRLSTDAAEQADPDSLSVRVGDYVQFVSVDWFVHEVAFELDALRSDQRAFLQRTGQSASPPLLEQDGRFVLTFAQAPPGRYPYTLAGNRAAGRGLIVVVVPE